MYIILLFKYLSLYQGYFVNQIQLFLEQMLRSAYATTHALGMFLAVTRPRSCTVEYPLLSICSENVQNAWSVSSLSHSQTSSGKSFCQDALGQGLCDALTYCHPSEQIMPAQLVQFHKNRVNILPPQHNIPFHYYIISKAGPCEVIRHLHFNKSDTHGQFLCCPAHCVP